MADVWHIFKNQTYSSKVLMKMFSKPMTINKSTISKKTISAEEEGICWLPNGFSTPSGYTRRPTHAGTVSGSLTYCNSPVCTAQDGKSEGLGGNDPSPNHVAPNSLLLTKLKIILMLNQCDFWQISQKACKASSDSDIAKLYFCALVYIWTCFLGVYVYKRETWEQNRCWTLLCCIK